ncbi:MAG: hypothetical protein HY962_09530 [Ignavibacteriae bacterium]|nr:hypothetical protein [Ignavibacteriota bacterium]
MKTTQRALAAIVAFLMLAPFVSAQTSDPGTADANPFATKDLWAAGVHAGFLSGMGLSARFHPQGRFAVQLTGGGFKSGKVSTYSFGLEGQFDFDNVGRSRFYGYLGTGLYSWKDNGTEKLDGEWRAGIGLAYEWEVSKKLIFCANGAITYFSDGSVYPMPQIGLFYYFN